MSRAVRRVAQAGCALGALALAACGGGGGPTGPSTPPTPPPPTYSVTAVVFYDQNGNGQLDSDEDGRLPGVTVEVGGRRATTELLTGRARVGGVLGGSTTASVRPESLPLFWVPGAAVPVSVPTEQELHLPVSLPIGGNNAGLYMAFGDSITEGDGATNGRGYVALLEDRLRAGFGMGEVRAEGVGGTSSEEGAERLGARLNRNRPAFTLILYGTNDWNDCDDVASCFTLDALASMVALAKSRESLPVLGTIPPVNVGFDNRVPPRRNEWVKEADTLIRELARREGVPLADIEAGFLRAANGNLATLFDDHVHPNDRGHEIIADEFYKALTAARQPASTSRLAAPRVFGPTLAIPGAPAWREPRPRPDAPLDLAPLELRPLGAPAPRRGVRDLTERAAER